MRISIENNKEIERFILLVNIGIIEALKDEIISLEEAENYLYSPYTQNKLEKMDIREEIIELINLGCELENVKSIIPDELVSSMNDIEIKSKELLKLLPKSTLPAKKWID